jgi:hypothetical protein
VASGRDKHFGWRKEAEQGKRREGERGEEEGRGRKRKGGEKIKD